jgi:hypothetical protein
MTDSELKIIGRSLTAKGEMPNTLIQKWRTNSNKGGLL